MQTERTIRLDSKLKIASARWRGLFTAALIFILGATAHAQQSTVTFIEDFQTYGKSKKPAGWIDTKVGSLNAKPRGYYKTRIDPTQDKNGTNIVYGTTKSIADKNIGGVNRGGYFAIHQPKVFSSIGRFEVTGRMIRISTRSRAGLTVLNNYPEKDKYYLIREESTGTAAPTLRLSAFGAGTPIGRLDSGVALTPGKWYRFRVHTDSVAGVTNIRARFWLDGTTEPTTYAIDATDSSTARLVTGRFGVWAGGTDKDEDADALTPSTEANDDDDELLPPTRGTYVDNLSLKSPADTGAPTIQLFENGLPLDTTRRTDFGRNAAIEIRIADALSTHSYTATLDNVPYRSLDPITAEGVHVLKVRATDAVGNFTDAQASILIDKTAPTIALFESNQPLADNTKFKRAAAIDIRVADALSTVTSVAKLDGNVYNSLTPIAVEGPHVLLVEATDAVGNRSTKQVRLVIDLTAPAIAFFESGQPVNSGNAKFKVNPSIEIRVIDALPATLTATLDGNPVTSPDPFTIPITVDGRHVIIANAIDEAGNTTSQTLQLLVDKVGPVVVLRESSNVLNPAETAIFARNAAIDISVTDTTSEVQWSAKLNNLDYATGTPITQEQTHTLTVHAVDETGNVTDVTLSLLVDKTAPVVSFFEGTTKLDPRGDNLFRRDVAIEITAADATSTPTVTATLDGAVYQSLTPITTEGQHVIVVTAKDTAGNITTADVELRFLVDKTNPVIVLTESGNALPSGTQLSLGRDAKVGITVTDNLTGVTSSAKLDGSDYTSNTPITTEGQHTIAVHAVDAAGNEADATATLLIDKSGPSIKFFEVAVDGTKIELLPSVPKHKFKARPSIEILVADEHSTTTNTAKLNGADYTSLTPVAEGIHTLTVNAVDALGNTSEETLHLLVDLTAPVIVLREGANLLPASGAIFNHDLAVTAEVTDLSETTTTATLDALPFSLSVPVAEEGLHTLKVTAVDELEWPTTVTSTFTVDKTAPLVTVREGTSALYENQSFARDVVITATHEDITAVQYSATLDGNLYNLGTVITADGTHTIVVSAVDAAGNRSEPQTIRFHIERENPEIKVFESGNPFPVGTPFARDIVATIEVVAATAWTKVVTVDGAPYELGTPYGIEGDHHELVVVVTTAAGRSSRVAIEFEIDKTRPTIRLMANGAPMTDGQLFGADFTPVTEADDNLTKPPVVVVTLDGQTLAKDTVVSEEMVDHVISATATDRAGNSQTAGPFKFTLDKTDATVTIKVDGEELENDDQFRTAITPVIEAQDLTPTNVTATLDGASYDRGTPITEDGTHVLTVSVTDQLNHVTSAGPITFVIDKTPPVVTVLESDQPFLTGSKYKRPVTPTVRVVDTTDTIVTATLDGNVYTPGQEISTEGHHELSGLVTDELGWSTPIPAIRFTIDNTPPSVEVVEAGVPFVTGTIFNRDVKPQIVVTDATTTTVDATLDGALFVSETLITTEGAHTLAGKVTDELGLITDILPISFVIDKTPPVVVITEAGVPFVDGALLNHDAVPVATITDTTHVDITATLDGATYNLGTPITAEGSHTLIWSARDVAGWTTPEVTIRFVVDKTAPVVTITDGGAPLVSGVELGRSVTPVINITDISATSTVATLDGVTFTNGTEVSAEGTHTLLVTVTDAAGWPTVVPPITFLIDKTAPAVRVIEGGQPLVSGKKFNRPVMPQIVIEDATATTIVAKLGDATYDPDTLIETEGTHTLSVTVTDRGGNVTPVPPITFVIDRTAPVVTITESGQPFAGGAFKRSVKPEISIQDITATDVVAQLNEQPFTFGAELTEERRYTLGVTVTDELGWVTTVPTIGFAIDLTPPIVELVVDGQPLLTGALFNHAVAPRAIIEDTTDTTVTATLNGASYDLGTNIEAEGEYTLDVRVVDEVGLEFIVPTVRFRIDTTRPVLTFITPANQQTLVAPNVLVTGNSDDSVTVEVNGVVAEIDQTAKRFTVPSLELLEGPNTIVAIGTDAAGNVSDPVSVEVTVDTRAPEVTITSPAANACVTTKIVQVGGTIADPHVSAVSVAILPGTAPAVNATLSADKKSWSATLQFASEGKFVIAVTARDSSAHEAVATVQIRIDETKPRIEITESGAPFTAPFVNRTVAPFVRFVDADPNTTLTITLDGLAYVSGTPIAFEKNFQQYELKATATDCAGNKADDVIVRFVIDKTPPQFIALSPANGGSIGTMPAVSGTVSPDTVNVFSEGNGAAAAVANGTFTFSTLTIHEGANRFTLVAVDRAGNTARLDYSFHVKTAAPTVDIVENGSSIVSGTRYTRPVTVDVISNEAGAIITATRNGQPFTSGTVVSGNGSHAISATARDSFGHTSAAKEVTFTIDREGPVVTITEPADGITVTAERIRVRGNITGDPASATINGVPLPIIGGAFDTEVALDLGPNEIVVMALDAAGNSGVDTADVIRGSGTLGLILHSPIGSLPTNRRTTTVAGQVLTPAGVSFVTVNDIQVPIDAAGSFRKTDFPLAEGPNTITATVRKDGAEGSVSVTVNADFTPPAVAVRESGNALEDEARFATQAEIAVTATDNGQSITPTLLIDAAPAVSPAIVTANGGHSLIATARDAAGNETRVERTFFIGGGSTGGCALTDFDPADGALITADHVTLIGRTGGAPGVKVNGTAAVVSNNSFTATVNLPVEGANVITVTCTDANGTPAGQPKTITLLRATGSPSITITEPAHNSPSADELITVRGTIAGDPTQVLVNGVGATITGNTFVASNVRLSAGVNVIVARARNAAGRTATDSVHVTWLKNLPAISITSPATSLTVRTATLDVSGLWTSVDPASITVTRGGNAATVQTAVTSDTTGTFIAPSVPLIIGTQTITVRGLDRLGRAATATIEVTRADGEPSITITSPTDNTFFGSGTGTTFTVSGTFSAATTATVEVNGENATLTGSTFTASVPFSSLVTTHVVARVTEQTGVFALDNIRVSKLGAAPTVVSTFPETDDATNVDAGTLPLVLFSTAMDRVSVRSSFRLENAAGTAVSGDVILDRDVLTFAPAALLTAGERYTIRVAAGAQDLAGNAMVNAFARSFTIAATAGVTPPALNAYATRVCGSLELSGTASPNAHIRINLGTLNFNTSASATGAFTFSLPLSGRTGFQVARVRVVGSDGSQSAAAEAQFEVDCAGPHVTNATFDRDTNALTITFSKAINLATVTTGTTGSAQLQLTDGTIVGGTVSALATPSSVSIVPAQDLTDASFTLTVTTAVQDTGGAALTAPYSRAFTIGEPTLGDGAGYISGEVFDADTGRPLPGANVSIDVPVGAFARSVATDNISATAAVVGIADNRGRYLRELPEGAHTIRATAQNYTTVWRQIIVRTGSGVIPTDIRLTPRGVTKPGNGGALVLNHGGAPDTPLALPAELRIPAAMVATGNSVTLTSVGAQSLAGLLPLGWSPLASAEIVSNAASLSGAELEFTVPGQSITDANQTLTAVRYFDDRDEWRVVLAVVPVTGGKAKISINAAGAYALVYPDKLPRAKPLDPVSGGALPGVADPCAAETPSPCAPLAAKNALHLDPPAVLPTQRTVATLTIEGSGTSRFPSGTAVQAYVDEELRLADGTRDVVAPFATDLLLYRTLAGDVGEAVFHLAPSARASQVALEIGYDHIRIVPYPERLDRGTLIGPEGGRVPADESVSVEIPAGATTDALQATAVSIKDFASFGTIAGYRIVGGLDLSLTWAGQGTDSSPVELFKPARATFTVVDATLPSQLILVEVLEGTEYGRVFRLASQITALEGGSRFSTKTIDRALLPVDGIIREGRYLLLAPNAPIAFTTGTVHHGVNGPAVANARVLTPPLGVLDLTRVTGIFNVPVPAAIFSLVPRTTATGDGAAYNHPTAPAADAVVNVGALSLVSQPPTVTMTVFAHNDSGLAEVTAEGASGVSTSTSVKAVFSPGVDPQTVQTNSLTVLDHENGTLVPGRAVAQGNTGILWTLEPGVRLRANATYTAVIASTVRSTNGTPVVDVNATFSTVSTLTSPKVDPSKIRITMPDANGRAQIIGAPGALEEHWNAVAVRRFRDFSNRPQDTADGQRSFLIQLGEGTDPNNRVTIADEIYLQIINDAGAVAAIVPLGPFTTEDGRGFVAPANKASTFTTVDQITIAVPAGAFDVPTVVHLEKAEKTAFDDVPGINEELSYFAGFRIDFEGIAKKRLDITFPAPANLPADKTPLLGYHGMSALGPRIMVTNLLRRDGDKLTTTLPEGSSVRGINAQSVRGEAIVNPTVLRNMLLGIDRAAEIVGFTFSTSVAWITFYPPPHPPDFFIPPVKSIYYASFAAERDRILVPVAANGAFNIVGIDSGSGLEVFKTPYAALLPGEPTLPTEVTIPDTNDQGPYPVFTSPGRTETLEILSDDAFTDDSIRNIQAKYDGSQLVLSNATSPLPPKTRVEVINTRSSTVIVTEDFKSTGLTIPAQRGDRLIVLISEQELDPNVNLTVVFNEPIATDNLKSDFKLQVRDPSILSSMFEKVPEDLIDIQVNSGGRRVSIIARGGYQRGKLYRLTLSKMIKDVVAAGGTPLQLGQRASGPALPADLNLDFSIRTPHGVLGTFQITAGTVRDLAQIGNVLFISALEGGIFAYDVSNPVTLDNGPGFAHIAAPAGNGQSWGLSTDIHGRLYATGVTPMYGVVRSYRIEDFECGATSGCVDPLPNSVQRGNAIITWRTGINVGMPLASMVVGGWPEATPRKIKVVTRDAEPEVRKFEDLVGGTPVGNGFYQGTITLTRLGGEPYDKQRVTVVNVTRDYRWSADVGSGSTPTVTVYGQPTDEMHIIRNLSTVGVVSLFGYGIGVYDLNAVDANYRHVLDSSWERLEDTYVLSDGQLFDAASCDRGQQATQGRSCEIGALTLAPDAAVTTIGDSVSVLVLEQNKGLLHLTMTLGGTPAAFGRPGSMVFAEKVIVSGQGYRWFGHPRINQLRRLYSAASGRLPVARYASVDTFKRNGTTYALVTGYEYGLMVVRLDPKMKAASLVDVVWIPAGAQSVRVAESQDLAVVVDGNGRVLIVNLGGLDESAIVQGGPPCTNIDCEWPLFPTALAAITGPSAGGSDVGADDPRIVWKSPDRPADDPLVFGTIAPIFDADTGFLYTGNVLQSKMRFVSAVDPRVRFVGAKTDGTPGGRVLDRIIPLGIEPAVTPGTPSARPGYHSAFQIQMSLPGGVLEGLPDSTIQMAIESERVLGGAAGQSPSFLPRAHLRQTSSSGKKDPRPTVFAMHRDAPPDMPGTPSHLLRFQRGWNRVVSKWIVAIADPRAAEDYDWGSVGSAEKANFGCYSCEKPDFITGALGTDWYQLYTAGRVISARPERCLNPGSSGCPLSSTSLFEETEYSYLGKSRRLEGHISTIMADTVRPTPVLTPSQGVPIAVGAHQDSLLVHSGEVMSSTLDLDAGGRAGWNVVVDRTYRSRTLGLSPFGAGWDSSLFQRLRLLPNHAVEYRDGSGETWRFTPVPGGYKAPPAINLKLSRYGEGWRMIDVKQRITDFDGLGRVILRADEFYKVGTKDTGNAIHYLYDGDGRLSHIIDPVGRSSTITYEGESDQVSKIEDWRNREVAFHTDSAGLLKMVELPRTHGIDLEFDHSSPSSRPKQTYGYRSSGNSYNEQLELGTNLETIREPADTADRVKFEYYATGQLLDMLHFESWGTLDNAKSTFEYLLASDLPVSVETIVHDALAQKRTYTINGALAPKNYTDERVHVEKIVEAGVQVWDAADFGALPAGVTTASYPNEDVDRTWKFDYSAGRLHITRLMKPGSSTDALIQTTFGFATVADIGSVVSSRQVTSTVPGVAGISQTFDYGGDAFLNAVISDGAKVEVPEPHRGATDSTSTDGGVQVKSEINKAGQIEKVTSTAVSAPATGIGAFREIGYHGGDDSMKHRRSMPSVLREGTGSAVTTNVTYDFDDPNVVTFSRAGRSYTTVQKRDEMGRIIRTSVTGTGVDADDVYGYDASGRLRIHRRKHGDQFVEERYQYDVIGRVINHETWQGPAIPNERLQKTGFTYNLPDHVFRQVLPGGGEIETTIDKLGRMQDRVTNPKNPAFMGVVTKMTERRRYDIHDNVVYESDDVAAIAKRYDAAHRALETLHPDGTKTTAGYDGFGRLKTFADPTKGVTMTNEFTGGGKLQSIVSSSGERHFKWDGAGRTYTAVTKAGSGTPDHMVETKWDDAGRLVDERFGESAGAAMVRTFQSTSLSYGGSDQASYVRTSEDDGASEYSTSLTHDAFGRTTIAANTADSTMKFERDFDQGGNVTRLKTPGMEGAATYDYDGRSLMTEERLPAGGAGEAVNQFDYDDSGVLSRYLDPETQPTKTENDGIGRPFRRTYPDNSTEEIHYELWRVKKFKDRQNRWQIFNYDSRGRIETVTNDDGVELDRLVYDAQGRLISWRTPDSLMEFLQFDTQSRPQLTRQARYLGGAPLDDYTQSHTYDALGRRTTWTMPGASVMSGAPWTTSVTQRYDAVGNVIGIDRTAANGAGTGLLLTSDYRNSGRPNHRTLMANSGTAAPVEIRREYGYENAAGRLNLFRVFSSGLLTAGSDVTFEGTLRKSARLLGLANGERTTTWEYDDRGRLRGFTAATADPIAASVPGFSQTVTPKLTKADFLYEVERSSGAGVPTSTFGETPMGHKIATAGAAPFEYKKADGSDGGGVRTKDGRFFYQFDEKQRLRTVMLDTSASGADFIRVVYSYNGGDRMIGRRVEIADNSSGVIPPDTAFVLAKPEELGPDAGLPPSTTFAWDPISDHLVAVFEAEKYAGSAVVPSGRLIRQYIHGGLGLDDPIEVTVADSDGVHRYYPIYDEAGDGNLQVILTETGKIVTRTILTDPYGDGEIVLAGPAVEKVTVKPGSGSPAGVHVDIEFTEPIEAATLAAGMRLSALTSTFSPVVTSSVVPMLVGDGRLVRWDLTAAQWSELSDATDARLLSIAVSDALTSSTYTAGISVLPANTTLRGGVFATPQVPFELHELFDSLNERLASGGPVTPLYELTTLSGMAQSVPSNARTRGGISSEVETADSGASLLLTASFQAQSFTDPFTLKNYVRARWYDPATTTFLSPDPSGYRDSSNLYAFGAGDPVNHRDPTGEAVYLIYREFNGALLKRFYPLIGHYYLAFDAEGLKDPDRFRRLVITSPTQGYPLKRYANPDAETFSFHPRGVRSDDDGSGAIASTFVTQGSYIGYNDKFDQDSFRTARAALQGNGQFERQRIWKITEDDDEQERLYLAAVRERREMNERRNDVFGSYYLFHNNCGTWSQAMIERSGLTWPSEATKYNGGGAGLGGPQDYIGLSHALTGLLGAGGYTVKMIREGEYYIEMVPDPLAQTAGPQCRAQAVTAGVRIRF